MVQRSRSSGTGVRRKQRRVIRLRLSACAVFACTIFNPPLTIAAETPPAVTNDWVLRVNSQSDSSPAIAPDGTIYFGTFDGRLWAVNPDGSRKWVFKAGREIKSSPAVGEDGTIYFGSRDWKFHAVGPDGKKRWEFKTDAWVDSSPALAQDGTAYFGCWDKRFYALNASGKKQWDFPTGGPVVSSPAIGADGTVYFGSHDKKFYALSPAGKKLWEFATGGPIISSPALDWEGGIYFTSTDGCLYVLQSDGTLRWKLQALAVREGSPVLGFAGRIFLCAHEGIWSITPEGKQKWYRGTEEMDCTPAIAASGLVVFAYRGGQVTACDQDRTFEWVHYIYPCGAASPAIGGQGTIYMPGEMNRSLTAIHGTSPLARTPWPKFRGNARNTGNIADSPR